MTEWIRENYPKVELTSKANRDIVREILNIHHHTGFNSNDVWTDRTAPGNQFRYLMRHLELFDEIFEINWITKRINLTHNGKDLIENLLAQTEAKSHEFEAYGDIIWMEGNR